MRLNYRGTVLLPADIKLLAGPHWLNDTILSFLLEHYEQDEFPHLAQVRPCSQPQPPRCSHIMVARSWGRAVM